MLKEHSPPLVKKYKVERLVLSLLIAVRFFVKYVLNILSVVSKTVISLLLNMLSLVSNSVINSSLTSRVGIVGNFFPFHKVFYIAQCDYVFKK